MFAIKPRIEFAFRVVLIAAILLSAAPTSFTVHAADPTDTPTETPTAEPTVTPTEVIPPSTETPVPATETPSPIETLTVTETASVLPTESAPTSSIPEEAPMLALSSDPGFLTPGGMFMLRWQVNVASLEGLTLQIVLPEGISLQGTYEGTFEEANRTLSIKLAAVRGQVSLIADNSNFDVSIKAVLLQGSDTLFETSLVVPIYEQCILEKQGGEIIALEGKLKVKFPEDALSEKAVIKIGTPTGDAVPSYSLSGRPFEIKAQAESNGEGIKNFGKELTIEISYADLDIPSSNQKDLEPIRKSS